MKSRGTFVVVTRPAQKKLAEQLQQQPRQPEPPPPKGRPDPIGFARFWLGERLEERGGAFYLDGRPAKLDQVMRAANDLARRHGKDMLTPNPAWVPDRG